MIEAEAEVGAEAAVVAVGSRAASGWGCGGCRKDGDEGGVAVGCGEKSWSRAAAAAAGMKGAEAVVGGNALIERSADAHEQNMRRRSCPWGVLRLCGCRQVTLAREVLLAMAVAVGVAGVAAAVVGGNRWMHEGRRWNPGRW